MVPARPLAPAAALFGAIGADRFAAQLMARAAEVREQALAQVGTVLQVRSTHGMIFANCAG